MPSPRPHLLGLESFEERLMPSLFTHAPDPPPSNAAITRLLTDARDEVAAHPSSAGERALTGAAGPAMLAAVRVQVDTRAELVPSSDAVAPEPGRVAQFLKTAASTAGGLPGAEGPDDFGTPSGLPFLPFFLRLAARELPPTADVPPGWGADTTSMRTLDLRPPHAPVSEAGGTNQGVEATGGTPLRGMAAGGMIFVGSENEPADPLPSREDHPATPVDVSLPPDAPAVPIQVAEPIRVEIPSGIPLAGLLAEQLAALEDSARAVLARLPGGEEVADALADPAQYLWFTGAVLVTAAAGYTVRANRPRAGDRVTLGTDSVAAYRENKHRGERAPP